MIANDRPYGTAMEFAVSSLQEDPSLSYEAVRERAARAGLMLPPILYGRAKKQLGLQSRNTPPPLAAPREAAVGAGAEELEVEASVEVDAEFAAAPAVVREPVPARAADGAVKKSPSFDFVLQELRKDPGIVYSLVRDRAREAGFEVAPIVYGRAKALLGLVPTKPRGTKKLAKQVAALPRQLKQVDSVAADSFSKKLAEVRSLDQLVAIVRELDAERRRLRTVIEQVIDTLDATLG